MRCLAVRQPTEQSTKLWGPRRKMAQERERLEYELHRRSDLMDPGERIMEVNDPRIPLVLNLELVYEFQNSARESTLVRVATLAQ